MTGRITREDFEVLKKEYIEAKNKHNNKGYHLQFMIDSFRVFLSAGYMHSAKDKLKAIESYVVD